MQTPFGISQKYAREYTEDQITRVRERYLRLGFNLPDVVYEALPIGLGTSPLTSALHVMRRQGIRYLGELTQLSPSVAGYFLGGDRKSIGGIRQMLIDRGLRLGMSFNELNSLKASPQPSTTEQ